MGNVSSADRVGLGSAARRVAAFRSARARAPLHPAERVLLGVLGLHLAYLPWPLGCNRPAGEFVSLGLGLIGFAVALRPRWYHGEYAEGDPPFRIVPWRKLVRFPLFWIGAALLGYVLLQALNPDWRYVTDGKYWWLAWHRNVSWLPTSIAAPMDRWNAWRLLMIYADVWMIACSVWIGVTRRKSVRILLGVVVANAVVLAGVLGLQRTVANDRFPWPITAWTDLGITASFINRNQAGAYLDVCVFCALALSVWSLDYAEQTLKKSSPAGVLGIGALFLAIAVLFTLSRGAVLVLACGVAAFGVWFFIRRKRQAVEGFANRKVTLAIAAVFAVFLLASVRYLDFAALFDRFDTLATERGNDPSVSSRILARYAAEDMLRANGLRGVGAGSFQNLFPAYVKNYPEIYEGGQLFWQHAHCDWLEFPIELGVVGDAIVLAGFAWAAVYFVRRKVGWSAVVVPLLIGCAGTLAHAWFDFPFQCPAILGTWCAMAAAAGKWAELSGG